MQFSTARLSSSIVSTPTCIYVCMYIPSHRGTESTKTYGKRQPKPENSEKSARAEQNKQFGPKTWQKQLQLQDGFGIGFGFWGWKRKCGDWD